MADPSEDIYSRVPASSRATRFLRELLPALDSLDPDSNPITRFTNPSSRFLVGNSENVTDAATLHGMFKSRASMLQKFYHRVLKVWEVPPASQSDHTTIIFESKSVTVLKADKQENEVAVREVSILELDEDQGGGIEGFVIREMRSYLDPKPVMEAMKSHADVRIEKGDK